MKNHIITQGDCDVIIEDHRYVIAKYILEYKARFFKNFFKKSSVSLFNTLDRDEQQIEHYIELIKEVGALGNKSEKVLEMFSLNSTKTTSKYSPESAKNAIKNLLAFEKKYNIYSKENLKLDEILYEKYARVLETQKDIEENLKTPFLSKSAIAYALDKLLENDLLSIKDYSTNGDKIYEGMTLEEWESNYLLDEDYRLVNDIKATLIKHIKKYYNEKHKEEVRFSDEMNKYFPQSVLGEMFTTRYAEKSFQLPLSLSLSKQEKTGLYNILTKNLGNDIDINTYYDFFQTKGVSPFSSWKDSLEEGTWEKIVNTFSSIYKDGNFDDFEGQTRQSEISLKAFPELIRDDVLDALQKEIYDQKKEPIVKGDTETLVKEENDEHKNEDTEDNNKKKNNVERVGVDNLEVGHNQKLKVEDIKCDNLKLGSNAKLQTNTIECDDLELGSNAELQTNTIECDNLELGSNAELEANTIKCDNLELGFDAKLQTNTIKCDNLKLGSNAKLYVDKLECDESNITLGFNAELYIDNRLRKSKSTKERPTDDNYINTSGNNGSESISIWNNNIRINDESLEEFMDGCDVNVSMSDVTLLKSYIDKKKKNRSYNNINGKVIEHGEIDKYYCITTSNFVALYNGDYSKKKIFMKKSWDLNIKNMNSFQLGDNLSNFEDIKKLLND